MVLQDSKFYRDNDSEYLRKSFAGQMVRYQPNGTAPLWAMTSLLTTPGTAKDVEHGYFSKSIVFPKCTLTAAVLDDVATTYTVDSTATLLPGDLLRSAETGEIVRVQTIASATSITVLREVGQIAAGAVSNSTNLYCVGNAFEQASLRPQSRLINPNRVMNNTQIFRNSWALPKTVSKIMPVVGESLDSESRMDCAMFHSQAMETAMIFGQKSGKLQNGQYMTTMDGLIETVRRLAPAGNTNTAGATTNYDQLEAMVNPVFDTIANGRTGNDRLLLVGGGARKVINDIGRKSGQYQIVDGQTNFGLQFQTFKTSRGSFRMVEHPVFNSNDDWKKLALAVDVSALRLMYLEGRQTENIEYGMDGRHTDDGIDAIGGTLTTEMTMENINPSSHAVIWGLTSGVA